MKCKFVLNAAVCQKKFERLSVNIDSTQYYHFIIGSGIAVFLTQVWLAKTSYKVAVRKFHSVPSGFTYNFK